MRWYRHLVARCHQVEEAAHRIKNSGATCALRKVFTATTATTHRRVSTTPTTMLIITVTTTLIITNLITRIR